MENNEIMSQGANRFLFWVWNFEVVKSPIDGEYYPDAIVNTNWNCDDMHIYSKWLNCCRRAKNETDWALVKFYGELDGENRRKFLEWIMSNYTDEQSI